MKNILIIIKKEFSRFFKDKRMIVTVLLPGVLIYLVYSLMGALISDSLDNDVNTSYSAYVVNMPEDKQLSVYLDVFLEFKDYSTVEQAKQAVEDGSLNLLIVFPENFDEVLAGTDASSPDVAVYFNSSVDESSKGYMVISAVLESLKKSSFSVNASVIPDLAGEKESVGQILAMIMPMLLFALLVSGCIAVAPEAIAGEKERGTMATMLITPVQRWQIALGKIISLTCFALLSGLSSFIGVILSLPKITAGIVGVDMAAYYTAGDYFMLFGLILSVVLVIISAFSILSAFAKNVKEASSYIAPLMIVTILLGLGAMFVSGASLGLYAIPLFGSAIAMSAIFTFTITPLAFFLAFIMNIIVAVALVVVLSLIFNSERIMFSK